MSDAGYHRIAREWRERVTASADKLEFWVGVAAVLMLARCRFLPAPADPGVPALDGAVMTQACGRGTNRLRG